MVTVEGERPCSPTLDDGPCADQAVRARTRRRRGFRLRGLAAWRAAHDHQDNDGQEAPQTCPKQLSLVHAIDPSRRLMMMRMVQEPDSETTFHPSGCQPEFPI